MCVNNNNNNDMQISNYTICIGLNQSNYRKTQFRFVFIDNEEEESFNKFKHIMFADMKITIEKMTIMIHSRINVLLTTNQPTKLIDQTIK